MAAKDKTRIAKPSPIVEDEQGQLVAKRGISREVIEELSKVKGEPDWMRQLRVKSYEISCASPYPLGRGPVRPRPGRARALQPAHAGRYDSWDDVPRR